MKSAAEQTPDISVVIPVYNAGTSLRETLDSVLAQAGVVVEVVVVDDGSTDETQQVLSNYQDQILIKRIPNSGGPSIPRNVGVELATANLIAFFDSDDLMKPGKLATAVSAMAGYPRAGLFCTDFEGIDGAGVIFRNHWLAEYRSFRADLKIDEMNLQLGRLPAEKSFRHLIRANFVGTSSVVCRREALLEAGPFEPTYKNSDDRDMWYRIARSGWDFLFLDQVFHSYRKTGEGISERGGQRNKAIIASLSAQLEYLTHEEDKKFARERLRGLWQGYGYWLRSKGQYGEAQIAYKKAMALGCETISIIGWIRCVVRL